MERPKTANTIKRNAVDIMEFFNYIVEDLETISNRLYLLENSLNTTGDHKYPRALSCVRHKEAIRYARERVS